jgi:predicted secreted protein
MTTSAIVTQGVAIQRGDGGGPEVFTTIGEITDFTGPGGSAAVIDATHFQSTAIDKLMGLPDEGQFSFNMNMVPGDAEQTGLRSDRSAQTLRNFKIILTDAGAMEITFAAFVLEFSIAGAQNDKVNASVTLEVSGAVTYTP